MGHNNNITFSEYEAVDSERVRDEADVPWTLRCQEALWSRGVRGLGRPASA